MRSSGWNWARNLLLVLPLSLALGLDTETETGATGNRKNLPGTACFAANGTDEDQYLDRDNISISNHHPSSARYVVCPIVRDTPASTGFIDIWARVRASTVGALSCTAECCNNSDPQTCHVVSDSNSVANQADTLDLDLTWTYSCGPCALYCYLPVEGKIYFYQWDE